tara:strand:+ start:37 stop:702 length:666 start_codon:yes stop_codon:yes gene_type:complete
MEPNNRFLLPILGLISPFFFLVLALDVEPTLSSMKISFGILFEDIHQLIFHEEIKLKDFVISHLNAIVILVVYLIIITWSHDAARSQRKYFRKVQESSQGATTEINKERYGTCFFINTIAILIAAELLFFLSASFIIGISEKIGVGDFWYQGILQLSVTFIFSNIFRVTASIMFFSVGVGISLKSIKFILLKEILIYGLLATIVIIEGEMIRAIIASGSIN